jgi:hypothetical protein
MVIRILLVVVLLFAASAVFGKDLAVARAGSTVLTLTDLRAGCDWAEGAKRARIVLDGKEYLGCYLVVGDVVYVQWDDGDRDRIPSSAFEPTT